MKLNDSPAGEKRFIGIYLEPREDLESRGWDVPRVLDFIKETVRADHVFLRLYGYADPRLPYFVPTAPYYKDTALGMEYPAELPFDVTGRVCEEAAKRDLHVHAYLFPCKNAPVAIRNHERALEVDLEGRPGRMVCFNNPDFKNHFFALVRDLFDHYPLHGAMYGSERGGPLFMFLKLAWPATCFCEHCRRVAHRRGMDSERAKEGFRQLVKLLGSAARGGVAAARNAPQFTRPDRPGDGFFISFLRLLCRYPEILFWNHMFHEHQLALQTEMHRIIKSSDPLRIVGCHLWHRGRAFSPLMRAEEDLEDLIGICDFIKPAIFTNPGGMRFIEEAVTLTQTIFGDLDVNETANALYKFCGYRNEGPIEAVKDRPLSSTYVRAEVAQVKARIAGRTKLYAGIAAAHYKKWTNTPQTPDNVKADIRAAVEAGADGFIFGSVDLDTLGPAIGEGLKDVGWAP